MNDGSGQVEQTSASAENRFYSARALGKELSAFVVVLRWFGNDFASALLAYGCGREEEEAVPVAASHGEN